MREPAAVTLVDRDEEPACREMHVAHHLGGGLHRREGEMAALPLVVDLVDREAAVSSPT